MNDTIRGIDLNGAMFWMAELINGQWIGTGKNQTGLIRHIDLRSAIQFYLSYYPQTDEIQAMLAGRYRFCMPSQAAMSIVDAVLEELDPDAV